VQTYDSAMAGTLARLAPEQFIRLRDLYYGLMLPSGNDAACILASYYGFWLMREASPPGPLRASRRETLKV
jgi:D-alanyl-D-alanine carboxypeptidase